MALTIYRRHIKACSFFGKSRHARNNRDCKLRCPIWVQGTLAGEKVWKSLDLADWSKASDLIHGREATRKIGVEAKKAKPVADAITEHSGRLRRAPPERREHQKYRTLLRKHIQGFCAREALKTLDDFDLPKLRSSAWAFRSRPSLRSKPLRRPARSFSSASTPNGSRRTGEEAEGSEGEADTTLPFEEEDVTALLDACAKWPEVLHQTGTPWKG